MAGDRGLTLLVQAAATKGLDFDSADLLDRHWWLKARWVLDQMEIMRALDLCRLQHAQHCSVLDYGLQEKTFDTHWGAANDILKNVHAAHFPWAKGEGERDRTEKYAALMAQWREVFGDPNDPAVKDRYRKIAERMRQRSERAKANMFSESRKLTERLRRINAKRKAAAGARSKSQSRRTKI